MDKTKASNGDLIFFGADKEKVVNEALGALREKIGHDKGLVNDLVWAPLWIVDFPCLILTKRIKGGMPCTTLSLLQKMDMRIFLIQIQVNAYQKHMTWLLMALKLEAALYVSIRAMFNQRCLRL
jgi:hypothetical protein